MLSLYFLGFFSGDVDNLLNLRKIFYNSGISILKSNFFTKIFVFNDVMYFSDIVPVISIYDLYNITKQQLTVLESNLLQDLVGSLKTSIQPTFIEDMCNLDLVNVNSFEYECKDLNAGTLTQGYLIGLYQYFTIIERFDSYTSYTGKVITEHDMIDSFYQTDVSMDYILETNN